jgi:hypothetical protein
MKGGKVMKDYRWKLVLTIILIMSLGYLIPSDFKVLYGLCSGLSCGTYFVPILMKERLEREIEKAWRSGR